MYEFAPQDLGRTLRDPSVTRSPAHIKAWAKMLLEGSGFGVILFDICFVSNCVRWQLVLWGCCVTLPPQTALTVELDHTPTTLRADLGRVIPALQNCNNECRPGVSSRKLFPASRYQTRQFAHRCVVSTLTVIAANNLFPRNHRSE